MHSTRKAASALLNTSRTGKQPLQPILRPSDNLDRLISTFELTHPIIDIITFAEDPAYLNRKLYPAQREILGEFFNSGKSYEELLLICGRDSTKTFMAAIIACYTAYLWLEIPDPYYLYQGRVDRGKEVHIICVAVKEEQATILLDEIKAKIIGNPKEGIPGSPYFAGKVVSENSFELVLNKNLHIVAVTSNSASEVGKTAFMVLFDEIGKYGVEQGTRDGEEVYNSLTPSVGRFASNRPEFLKRCAGDHGLEIVVHFLGRVVSLSTPMAEQGILWQLYNTAQRLTSILWYKRPTWEMNPNYPVGCKYLKDKQDANPEKFNREYGAQFAKAISAMFPPDLVDRCVSAKVWGYDYRMEYRCALDTSKNRDAFAFAIGHLQGGRVIIDRVQYWLTEDGKRHNWNRIEHDIRLLTMQFRAEHIAHDGYESEGVRLHFDGFMLEETPFSGKYKMEIYSSLESLIHQDLIEYPNNDRLIAELKALTRRWNGDKFTIHHPDDGPVRNDDGADAVANVAHILYKSYVDTGGDRATRPHTTGTVEWPEDHLTDGSGGGPVLIMGGQHH